MAEYRILKNRDFLVHVFMHFNVRFWFKFWIDLPKPKANATRLWGAWGRRSLVGVWVGCLKIDPKFEPKMYTKLHKNVN